MKSQKHFCEKCMKETNFFEEIKEQEFLFDNVVKVSVNIPKLQCTECLNPLSSSKLTKEEKSKVLQAYKEVTGRSFDERDKSRSIIYNINQ